MSERIVYNGPAGHRTYQPGDEVSAEFAAAYPWAVLPESERNLIVAEQQAVDTNDGVAKDGPEPAEDGA